MSQNVFKPTNTEKLELDKLCAYQTCILAAVVRRLGEVWASGISTTRGDIRSVVHMCFYHQHEDGSAEEEYKRCMVYVPDKLKRDYRLIELAAGPFISIGGDMQEFKVSDSGELENFDNIAVTPSEGALLIRSEVYLGDEVYGVDMRTLLWSGREESPTLVSCLKEAVSALRAVIFAGVTISMIDRDALSAAVMGAECQEGFGVNEVRVTSLYGIHNVGLPTSEGEGKVSTEVLEEGQVLSVRMHLEITMENGDSHTVGFEKMLEIGRVESRSIGKGKDRDPFMLIPSIRPMEDAPRLYALVYTVTGQPYNFFWDESAPAKVNSTLGRKANDMFAEWEEVTGLSREMITTILVGKPEFYPSSVTLMRIMLSEIHMSSKTYLRGPLIPHWLSEHTKYGYKPSDLKQLELQYSDVIRRGGDWVNEIDGPALDQARDVLARLLGISSREVALMGSDGPEALMPDTYQHPQFGLMTFRKRDGLVACLRCFFLIYSGRSLPWPTDKKVDTADKSMVRWIKLHLRNPRATSVKEDVVTWQLFAWREKGKDWLNRSALHPSLAHLAVAANDWCEWLKHSNASIGNPSTHPVFSVLLNDLPSAFPYYVKQDKKRRVSAIRGLISKLASMEQREKGGLNAWNDRYFTESEIYIIALTLFLNHERPRNPLQENAGRKIGFLPELTARLPHRTDDDLNSALSRKSEFIENAYRDLCRQIRNNGFDALRPYIAGDVESAIQTFLDEGLMELAEQYGEDDLADDRSQVVSEVGSDGDSEDEWLLGADE